MHLWAYDAMRVHKYLSDGTPGDLVQHLLQEEVPHQGTRVGSIPLYPAPGGYEGVHTISWYQLWECVVTPHTTLRWVPFQGSYITPYGGVDAYAA